MKKLSKICSCKEAATEEGLDAYPMSRLMVMGRKSALTTSQVTTDLKVTQPLKERFSMVTLMFSSTKLTFQKK